MADFNENNNYNNQIPQNDRRPDYTYNWNGSEHSNGNRKRNGRGFAMVAVIIALVGILIVSTVVGYVSADRYRADRAETSSEATSSGKNDTSTSGNFESVKQNDRADVSVPDFTPRTDVAKGESDLTVIYEQASLSCCTIKVTPKSGSGYMLGSGFVINAEGGYIATNHHVIEDAKSIKVIFYDGREYDAELIGSDSVTDLAVLQIDAPADSLIALPIGSSDELKIGEQVMAIGTPYSEKLAGTMTIGHISGIARDIQITNNSGKVTKTMTLIQTDCAINPGNSGGPLIDMAGNVVGINSLKIASEEYEGLGFAIPITSATEIFAKLIAGEEIGESSIATATPRLGVTIYELEYGFDSFRLRPRCDYPEGVLVGAIEADTAVYAAGLEMFDIITDFNGKKVTSLEEFSDELNKYKAGQSVEMTVFRFNRTLTQGEYVTLSFKLDAST